MAYQAEAEKSSSQDQEDQWYGQENEGMEDTGIGQMIQDMRRILEIIMLQSMTRN